MVSKGFLIQHKQKFRYQHSLPFNTREIGAPMLKLSDDDFYRVVNFIKTNYGINLEKKTNTYRKPPDRHCRRKRI